MQIFTFRVLRDIVETGSFSRAAALNHITQSAVSQQIRHLEDQLSTQLFDRSGRRVELTPAGQVAYQAALEILAAHDRMREGIERILNVVRGTIRLATVYSVGLHELPPYTRQFLSAYPQVNVLVEFSRAEAVYDLVAEGRVDLGIVAYPEETAQVRSLPFRSDRLVVVCHPDHAWARLRQIALPEIKGVDFVAFNQDSPTRRTLDRELGRVGARVNCVLELDNVETIKQAVEINTGISILPLPAVLAEVERGTLCRIEVTDPVLMRPLGLLIRRNRLLPPALRAFLGVLTPVEVEEPEPDA